MMEEEKEPPVLKKSQLPELCKALKSCQRQTDEVTRLWRIALHPKPSADAKIFLMRLFEHIENAHNPHVSMKQLLKLAGATERTAHRYRNELRDAGLLEWTVEGVGGPGVICRYRLR